MMEEKLHHICQNDQDLSIAIQAMLSFEFLDEEANTQMILDDPPFAIKSETPVRVFARDASGGYYSELPDASILYVTSDGEVGVIAASFSELMHLLVFYPTPCWENILAAPKNGPLHVITEKMRAQAMREMDMPGSSLKYSYRETRAILTRELELDEKGYSIASLFECIKSTNVTVYYDNGKEISPGSPFMVHYP